MAEEVWYKLLPKGDANPVAISHEMRVAELKKAIQSENLSLNVGMMNIRTDMDGEVSKWCKSLEQIRHTQS
eukprot:5805893-Amphidinium_carterae.1